ncbi:MAG: thioredoxin family protein [Myxococcales bacterium]|nr:thioredoxin family protein [Myxococcales bacterium]
MAVLHLMLTSIAMGADSASEPPPPPPAVDFSSLPASASQRKMQPDGKPHPVLARVMLDRTGIAPGTTAKVGLHLVQDEGWHTYWHSPGDIGQPTEIAWTAPHDVAVGAHDYPVPQRFDQSGEVSYGYDGEVLLISEVTVPDGTPEGTHTLAAEANWLVCKSICIKGDAEVEIEVDVVAEAADAEPTPYAPLFAHYEAQHPTDALDADAIGWDFSLSTATVPADGAFRAVFLLTPTTEEGFAPVGEGLWPTFTPIVATDYSWGLIDPPKVKQLEDGRILVAMDAEAYEPEPIPTDSRIGGLVQLKVGDEWLRTEITAGLPFSPAGTAAEAVSSPLLSLAAEHFPMDGQPSPAPGLHTDGGPETASVGAFEPASEGTGVSLWMSLLFAFAGGLILNIMPCVLPVLTLKLYGLVEQTDITQRDRQAAGVFYTAGILVSFLSMAALVAVLQVSFGMSVGWGFQFQYPAYVAALATVVFVFGLSLFGVFEIPAFGSGVANDAASKEGPLGYFAYGVFAVLLATPCSAPFLGSAIAYAFSAPPLELTLIFGMIGLGLASPFLAIAFIPALFQFLPRPGPWMETFKQLMGFTLMATAVWLVDVLAAQVGPDRTVGFLAFLTCAALGSWVFGHFGGLAATMQRQAVAGLVGVAIATLGGWYFLDMELDEGGDCDDGSLVTDLSFDEEIPWQPFSEERVSALAGTPVFIDFTADWCLTCKVNERTILETETVRMAMAEAGVVPLKADWTRKDEVITEWLRRYKRAGVPMYLMIPGDSSKDPILLPEVITPSMVLTAIDEAS